VQGEGRGWRVPRSTFAGLGFALLIGAWAFASPIGAAPDETAHIVRAAAADVGQFEGRAVAPYQRGAGLAPAQADFLNRQTQEFSIPVRLVPPSQCFAAAPEKSAACAGSPSARAGSYSVAALSSATTAPPFVYVLAGLAMQIPQDLVLPAYLGRLALGLVCALLLGAAASAASGRGSLWPVVGLALAVTPMVLFLASSLTPAGVAVSAAICLMAAVVALWTGPPTFGLVSVAVLSAVALVLARPSGLVVLAAVSLAALPLVRGRLLLRPVVLLALLVVAGSVVVEVGWVLGHQPSLPLGGLSLTAALSVVVAQWPILVEQLIGVFGLGDVPLPVEIPAVWSVLVVLLIGAALVIGSLRERLAILVAAGAAVVLATAVYALILAPGGWELQGRYILAVAALLPLLAGFVLYRAGAPTRADVFLVGLAVAAMQFAAFWENARRYAVGLHGPLDFVSMAEWAPPGGWLLWVVLAATGSMLIALSLIPLTAAERQEGYGGIVDHQLASVSR
jgi:hypothetical protein